MATVPSQENLWDLIRDLQRRLRDMETGARVGYSSIPDGGALTVLDSGGTPVLRIGTLSGGGHGIERWDGSAWAPDQLGDTAWQTPTLLNSWVNYGTGYRSSRYRKLSNGQVEIQGLVKSGANQTSVFVLPVGYRPAEVLIVTTSSTEALGRIEIRPDGSVFAFTSTSGWLNLQVTFTPG